MNVFIALKTYETEILGVYATFEEAAKNDPDAIDEYVVGEDTRIRSWAWEKSVLGPTYRLWYERP